ncbi:bcl-2-modifying factor-like isoform 2-T3 [Salvelinus alpinus]|uniref:bcl-2-modifying factor-like n=1 Tax=Salvelinus alpinus TaxID=8036 RepID=UPI0039FD869F
MDDEEEDMSLQHSASQCWGIRFRDIKFHTRDSRGSRDTRDRGDTQDRSSQMSTGPNAIVPRSEGHNIMVPQGHNNNTLPCGVQDNHQARMLLHGNAGFCLHYPARFEPVDDQGERQNDEVEGRREDDDDEEERRRLEERLDEERVEDSTEDSTEVRVGRKLREIGDQFHQDHVQLFLRHQRDVLPVWMRLTMTLYGFLFNRGPPAIPRLRGQER